MYARAHVCVCVHILCFVTFRFVLPTKIGRRTFASRTRLNRRFARARRQRAAKIISLAPCPPPPSPGGMMRLGSHDVPRGAAPDTHTHTHMTHVRARIRAARVLYAPGCVLTGSVDFSGHFAGNRAKMFRAERSKYRTTLAAAVCNPGGPRDEVTRGKGNVIGELGLEDAKRMRDTGDACRLARG